jgi:hypothetical protein
MRRAGAFIAFAIALAVSVRPLPARQAAAAPVATPATFAARVAALSEPGGYFDTDDLISNERSYLHVVPALRQAGLDGGAYIGVGPDTNFSYIAHTRPSIAFVIDLRRDNLLLHLLFKAIFAQSKTRVDYLGRLLGRAAPADLEPWRKADAGLLVSYLDHAPPLDAAAAKALRTALETTMRGFGVPLTPADLQTIDRFHGEFEVQGLDLKLEIHGRGTPYYYPTYRDLLTETDREGHQASYCASEEDFQFVRGLEVKDLVIPVVGDLSGATAMRNIARFMAERGVTLGAFYTSNVEYYLFTAGSFQAFVDNVNALPHTGKSLIIRSAFVSAAAGMVPMLPGYGSASMVGRVEDLLAGVKSGRIRSYRDLVSGR